MPAATSARPRRHADRSCVRVVALAALAVPARADMFGPIARSGGHARRRPTAAGGIRAGQRDLRRRRVCRLRRCRRRRNGGVARGPRDARRSRSSPAATDGAAVDQRRRPLRQLHHETRANPNSSRAHAGSGTNRRQRRTRKPNRAGERLRARHGSRRRGPRCLRVASAVNGSSEPLTYAGAGTEHGSVAAAGAAISADGREVAFVTTAVSNLVGTRRGTPAPPLQVRCDTSTVGRNDPRQRRIRSGQRRRRAKPVAAGGAARSTIGRPTHSPRRSPNTAAGSKQTARRARRSAPTGRRSPGWGQRRPAGPNAGRRKPPAGIHRAAVAPDRRTR